MYIFDGRSDVGAVAQQAMRYSIHDNLLDDINSSYAGNGSGNGTLNRFAGSIYFAPPKDIMIFHNTGLTAGGNSGLLNMTTAPAAPFVNFSFKDNLMSNGTYGITGCKGALGTNVLNSCTMGFVFAGNAIIGGAANGIPGNNWLPPDSSSVNFVNYNNGNGGDYRLCQGPGNPSSSCTVPSAFANAASDGTDIGADINTLETMTAGGELRVNYSGLTRVK